MRSPSAGFALALAAQVLPASAVDLEDAWVARIIPSTLDGEWIIGLNLRGGYVVPQVRAPWRLSLMGGWYYTTMIVTGNLFGFRNMSGPQFYPTVRRLLPGDQTISGYLKVSPMANGFGLLPLSSRELAAGVAWTVPLGNRHPLALSLDVANFRLAVHGVGINTTSVSLGAGYGL